MTQPAAHSSLLLDLGADTRSWEPLQRDAPARIRRLTDEIPALCGRLPTEGTAFVDQARAREWSYVVTLVSDGPHQFEKTVVVREIASAALDCGVVVLRPPADRRSWLRLERALETEALLVVIDEAQDVPGPVLAALSWLVERYENHPVMWLIAFGGPPGPGGVIADLYSTMARRAGIRIRLAQPELPEILA